MNTVTGNPSGSPFSARASAEREGFVFEAQAFEHHYQGVVESYVRELDPQQYRIVREGNQILIGFRNINRVLKSATMARICMKVGESPRKSLAAPSASPDSSNSIDEIGSATARIIAQAQKVRKGTTGVFERPQGPQQ